MRGCRGSLPCYAGGILPGMPLLGENIPATIAQFATATAPGGTAPSVALTPPPDDLARLSPTVDLRDVELAIEGDWDASTGRAPLSRATFESILAGAADPEVDLAPAHFGHFDPRFPALSDGEPAVGWVRPTGISQRPDGRAVLIGDITNVPTSLVHVIRNAYRRRSIEMATGLTTPSGRHYPAVMTGLGLLGVRAPAVKGLRDLAARYLSAPVAPAGGGLATVYVEGMPGDTPPPVALLPDGRPGWGHDGRVTRSPSEEAAGMPTRVSDERLRQLLGYAGDANVASIQAAIAATDSVPAAPTAPAAPAAPVPPVGYTAPPGYQLVPAAVPAAPAAGTAPVAQPTPVYQPGAAPAGGAVPAVAPAYQPGAAPAGYQFQPAPVTPVAQPVAGMPGVATLPQAYQPVPAPQVIYAQPQQAPAAPAFPAGATPMPGMPMPGTVAAPVAPPSGTQVPVGAAVPGQVAAAAGGVVALSADQFAALQTSLGRADQDRRDRIAWDAFAAGKISAAEHPHWRAELDRDEATATRMLAVLTPGRVPVTPAGSATALSAGAPAADAAADAFAAATFPEVAERRRQQAAAATAAAPRIGL